MTTRHLDPTTRREHLTEYTKDAHAAAWDLLHALDQIRDLNVSDKADRLREALHEALGETHRVVAGKGETFFRALDAIESEGQAATEERDSYCPHDDIHEPNDKEAA